MGIFKRMRDRVRRNDLSNAAIQAKIAGNFRLAAETYAAEADYYIDDNKLIFADCCINSAENWIADGNGENALGQARRALQGYKIEHWLTDDNYREEYEKNITDLVQKMSDGGFAAQSDALLSDLNDFLVKNGAKPLNVCVYTTGRPFPDQCSSCGGKISYSGNLDVITCPYCGKNVHCLN